VSQPNPPHGSPEVRDELDRRITRTLRALPDLPAPSPDDPDDDMILRALDGSASTDELERIAASRHARERLEILRAGVGAPSIVSATVRYVFRVAQDLIDLLRGATAPIAAPATAWAVRSTGASPASVTEPFCEFHHQFNGLDAHVRVEQVGAHAKASLDLQVRLTDAGTPLERGRVTIRREGRTLDSIPTDASGSALFTGLAPDTYEVELRHPGGIAGVMLLEFLPA
jgi:hypothetical protein